MFCKYSTITRGIMWTGFSGQFVPILDYVFCFVDSMSDLAHDVGATQYQKPLRARATW